MAHRHNGRNEPGSPADQRVGTALEQTMMLCENKYVFFFLETLCWQPAHFCVILTAHLFSGTKTNQVASGLALHFVMGLNAPNFK